MINSNSALLNHLNTLILLIQEKNFPIETYLKPGLSRQAIATLTRHLPFEFPEELYTLYQWHNGTDPACQFALFRDQLFLSLEDALKEYDKIVYYYVDELEQLDIDFGVDLRHCFPFASFEGSYYVLVCYPMENKDRPIFSVFEGVEQYFNSFSSLLSTCIVWCQQGVKREYGIELSQDLELKIWKQYNPGVFD